MSTNSNIKNKYYNNLDIRLSNVDYWDMFLSDDRIDIGGCDCSLDSSSMVVHFDFNRNILSGNTIFSLVTWSGATNTGYTLKDIGFTGVDNGLITFDRTTADTTNFNMVSAMTGSVLTLISADTRLFLNKVTGNTGNFIYPIDIITPNSGLTSVGTYAKFCGGFYQGYYNLDGTTYKTLPNRVNKAWVAEFWLKKGETCTGTTGVTLNDVYPDNKGFFFYMGTRAENKYWNCFGGLNTGTTADCSSGCTSGCTVLKEYNIETSSGVSLCPSGDTTSYSTDNGFLIYSRACNRCNSNSCGGCSGAQSSARIGYTACNFSGGSIDITSHIMVKTDFTNPFLIYSRACSSCGSNTCGGCVDSDSANTRVGQTACSYSGDSKILTEFNLLTDIIDNALGFRIKDDGSIGYRLLTVTATCINNVTVTGTSIQEGYSSSGMVSDNIWSHIGIRYVADTTLDDCQLEYVGARTGTLMFYVDGKLKYYVNNFKEFIARRLFEYKEKQEAVPFNISLGGGSQGLLESITFDGPDPYDIGLPIATNFAGTFIGDISQFRFYIEDVDYCTLQNNFVIEADRYDVSDCNTNWLLQQDGFLILQENGFDVDWL